MAFLKKLARQYFEIQSSDESACSKSSESDSTDIEHESIQSSPPPPLPEKQDTISKRRRLLNKNNLNYSDHDLNLPTTVDDDAKERELIKNMELFLDFCSSQSKQQKLKKALNPSPSLKKRSIKKVSFVTNIKKGDKQIKKARKGICIGHRDVRFCQKTRQRLDLDQDNKVIIKDENGLSKRGFPITKYGRESICIYRGECDW